MRMTTLLKKLLGTQHLLVTGSALEDGALVIEVRPSWRAPRCSGCKKRRGRYDTLPPRRWRHLDFGGVRVYVRYGLRRVSCRVCGVVAEAVPWCDNTTARFTTPFEEAVGFLVQRCDQTSVQEIFRVAWVTVGQIVERVMQRHRPDDPLDGLMAIGIDELSYRKGHKYVTTVTDQLSGRIVWAAEGKNAATLTSFFAELGAARCAAIAVVTMDMSEAYITVVTQQVPQAQIVFDRFHVQQLVNEALDETRREEWRRLREVDEQHAKTVKGLRWSLLKNPWNLTPTQSQRLSTLQQDNGRLYRAYLLKETFAGILDRHQPNVVTDKLNEWLPSLVSLDSSRSPAPSVGTFSPPQAVRSVAGASFSPPQAVRAHHADVSPSSLPVSPSQSSRCTSADTMAPTARSTARPLCSASTLA